MTGAVERAFGIGTVSVVMAIMGIMAVMTGQRFCVTFTNI